MSATPDKSAATTAKKLARTAMHGLLVPFFLLGTALEYVIFGSLYALLRLKCLLGWHSWTWEPWCRVPFYGLGAWQCNDCFKVKVKP